MATAAVTSSNITLKGSTTIVTEFFGPSRAAGRAGALAPC